MPDSTVINIPSERVLLTLEEEIIDSSACIGALLEQYEAKFHQAAIELREDIPGSFKLCLCSLLHNTNGKDVFVASLEWVKTVLVEIDSPTILPSVEAVETGKPEAIIWVVLDQRSVGVHAHRNKLLQPVF
ncbi:hypothetical protein [Acaryochloris sp. CCMEE 5410]|uniref:hypothetical protein n=1 Tax=Acaryochloris sp. CCMEE 5410 TaxID=310037 RepID=UPI0002483FBB|nr:hypothetical protein [Acaryochloris sp. CCMEE 5410]KAI9129871.1 hypothetical protein ON05_032635 [Acaryochloris sp. CCMEE 5410]